MQVLQHKSIIALCDVAYGQGMGGQMAYKGGRKTPSLTVEQNSCH